MLENMLVTQITPPGTVQVKEGTIYKKINRTDFGLSLCKEGQITYTMHGKKYISNRTNAVLLPQGGTYSLHGDVDGLFPLINFTCENLTLDEIIVFPLQNPQVCMKLCETMSNQFLYKSGYFKIQSTFYELLHEITSENKALPRRLNTITQYIEKNLSNPELSNTVLAKQISISEAYLRDLFLAHYNITPKQYILDLRVRKAKQMLVNTPYTVTAIAKECGFSSLYHFCRIFKKKTGMAPTEYAAKNKLDKI